MATTGDFVHQVTPAAWARSNIRPRSIGKIAAVGGPRPGPDRRRCPSEQRSATTRMPQRKDHALAACGGGASEDGVRSTRDALVDQGLSVSPPPSFEGLSATVLPFRYWTKTRFILADHRTRRGPIESPSNSRVHSLPEATPNRNLTTHRQWCKNRTGRPKGLFSCAGNRFRSGSRWHEKRSPCH